MVIKHPLVSVIIPVFNAEKKISKCLDSLLNQTYKLIEIIVVDDGSTDKTKEIIKKFIDNKKIFLLEQNRSGPGAAKNLASKKAKGKILVFVDSDEYLQPDYVEKLTNPIKNKRAKVSTMHGWYVYNPKNPWARCRFKDSSKFRTHAIKSGVFKAINKNLFFEIGGFNPKKGYSDDRLKTKNKRVRVKGAILYHDVDSTLKELFNKRVWIGKSIMANPKPVKFWIKLILGIMLFGFFITSFWINLWMTLGILILSILPMIYKTFSKIFFYKDFRLLFYYPIYSLITSIGMIVGFLKFIYEEESPYCEYCLEIPDECVCGKI